MSIIDLVEALSLLVVPIEQIDGYLLIDKDSVGVDGIRESVSRYTSMADAQRWHNIVLVDTILDELVGEEWECSDLSIPKLLDVFERAWSFQINAKYPGVAFRVERIYDEEYGDVWLRIIQDFISE